MRVYRDGESLPAWVEHAKNSFDGKRQPPAAYGPGKPSCRLHCFDVEYRAAGIYLDAEQYVGEGLRHLAALEESGVAVPKCEAYLTSPKGDERPGAFGDRRLYIARSTIHGIALDPFRYRMEPSPEIRKHLAELAGALSTYYTWIHDTKQTHFLGERAYLEKYWLGKQAAEGQDVQARVYSIDPEPFLATTPYHPHGQAQSLQEEIRTLTLWADRFNIEGIIRPAS